MALLARRSIVTARDVPAGTVITEADLGFKRPGTGMLPYRLAEVLGAEARRDLPLGTIIQPDDLESSGD